jgi:apolipoprotein N-acyltransferase
VFVNSVLCLAIGQGLNVFSVWWIGSAQGKLVTLTSGTIVGVYVALVTGYGLLSFIGCLIITYLSMISTESLASRIVKNIESVDLSWA